MPNTALFIDSLRLEFGKEGIDRSIKRGMKGEAGWFHARENGCSVGTPFDPTPGLCVADMVDKGQS